MITCKLGGKTYEVDYISARALREMGPAADMYGKIMRVADASAKGRETDESVSMAEAMDVMVKWFCIVFANQFAAEDIYEHYPADRIMHDIALTLMAVQTQATHVLSEFPTKPTAATAAE